MKKTISQKEFEKLTEKFSPVAPANPKAKLPKGKGAAGNYPMDSDKRFAMRLARREAEIAVQKAEEEPVAANAQPKGTAVA